jgi:hypothetical protein
MVCPVIFCMAGNSKKERLKVLDFVTVALDCMLDFCNFATHGAERPN